MNYRNYEGKIVEKYGVQLKGWPSSKSGICNPATLGGRQQLEKLLAALESGQCCYYYYSTSLFILFISSFTDAPYTSLFAIVYTITYSTQSPNIALFSCLLRTLGIVIHLYAQYISCLLRTLAV